MRIGRVWFPGKTTEEEGNFCLRYDDSVSNVINISEGYNPSFWQEYGLSIAEGVKYNITYKDNQIIIDLDGE